jgi:hypothetical protein
MGFYLFSSATFAPFARGKSFQHAKKLTVSSAEDAEKKRNVKEEAESERNRRRNIKRWIKEIKGLNGLGRNS